MAHERRRTTVSRAELSRDPYPAYRRLRDQGACVWLEAAGRYVVPRWEDVVALDDHPGITAREDPSLMTRAMGRTMLRVDGEEHARLRAPAQAPLRFRGFAARGATCSSARRTTCWRRCASEGTWTSLRDFAGPFAARTLKVLLGLHAARDADLEFASQAFIDGIGNYADDPDTWERCERANRLVDEAITADWDRAEEGTVLRALVDAGTYGEDEVRANIKLFISGGLNEPRDVIATTLHALLADPEQEALAREDPENLAQGDRGEPALDLADRDVPARRARGHRARRRAAGGRNAGSACSSPPRTATSATGRTPTASTCAARPSGTWPSRAARTSAPARTWRASRSRAPRSPRCWRCPASASRRPTCPTRGGSSAGPARLDVTWKGRA